MICTSDQENKDFHDLVLRAHYFFSLNDKYLQEELSNIKSDKINLKSYFDEATKAEAKRKSFQEISQLSSNLDPTAALCINKYEFNDRYSYESSGSCFRGNILVEIGLLLVTAEVPAAVGPDMVAALRTVRTNRGQQVQAEMKKFLVVVVRR